MASIHAEAPPEAETSFGPEVDDGVAGDGMDGGAVAKESHGDGAASSAVGLLSHPRATEPGVDAATAEHRDGVVVIIQGAADADLSARSLSPTAVFPEGSESERSGAEEDEQGPERSRRESEGRPSTDASACFSTHTHTLGRAEGGGDSDSDSTLWSEVSSGYEWDGGSDGESEDEDDPLVAAARRAPPAPAARAIPTPWNPGEPSAAVHASRPRADAEEAAAAAASDASHRRALIAARDERAAAAPTRRPAQISRQRHSSPRPSAGGAAATAATDPLPPPPTAGAVGMAEPPAVAELAAAATGVPQAGGAGAAGAATQAQAATAHTMAAGVLAAAVAAMDADAIDGQVRNGFGIKVIAPHQRMRARGHPRLQRLPRADLLASHRRPALVGESMRAISCIENKRH